MKLLSSRNRAAFTVVELLVAASVSSMILAGVALGASVLRKSYVANRNYIRDNSNSTRLIDYVSQDLRNAVQISLVSNGLATPLKTTDVAGVEIEGATQLAIFVPSYYKTNIPDNSYRSDYKTGIYNRTNLASGQTSFDYDTVTDVDSFPRTLKFLGNVEVRYVKKARSNTDSTPCYFRQEYDGGSTPTLRRENEIAEFGSGQKLNIIAIDPRNFRVGTSFSTTWTGEKNRDGTRQFSTVSIVNKRTDLK